MRRCFLPSCTHQGDPFQISYSSQLYKLHISHNSINTKMSSNGTATVDVMTISNRPREWATVDHTYHDFSRYVLEGGELVREKKSDNNFPAKLHQMLSDPDLSHIIAWMVRECTCCFRPNITSSPKYSLLSIVIVGLYAATWSCFQSAK